MEHGLLEIYDGHRHQINQCAGGLAIFFLIAALHDNFSFDLEFLIVEQFCPAIVLYRVTILLVTNLP